MTWEVLTGDAAELLYQQEPDSFDGILCDPPYGLAFMGKAWDHGVPGVATWKLAFNALKPGAHLLAFGGTRTYHRLACAIEDAGFEIRDCLSWLYGSGFPKSKALREVGPKWAGYGTALKPAWEPCLLAMKPTRVTFSENALAFGVAGLNVDGGRIAGPKASGSGQPPLQYGGQNHRPFHDHAKPREFDTTTGRWPSNLLLDEAAALALDQQSGERKSGSRKAGDFGMMGFHGNGTKPMPEIQGDTGGASRFFYVAKASRHEREAGLEGFERAVRRITEGHGRGDVNTSKGDGTGIRENRPAANHHPTVKPLALCEYLARLILPPKRDTPRRLLVPFSGSGSEMIGALLAGWDEVVGIELEPEYVAIAEARLRHWHPWVDKKESAG